MLGRTLAAAVCNAERFLIPATASHVATASRMFTSSSAESEHKEKPTFKQRYLQIYQDAKYIQIREQQFGPIPVFQCTNQHSTTAKFESRSDQLFGGVPYLKLPIVYVKAKWNNTRITVMDGVKIYSNLTCKNVGFFNAKKKTEFAGETVGLTAAEQSINKGCHKYVRVVVRGIGSGRKPSIAGLSRGGLEVVSITDRTPITNEGLCQRPRKIRRI